MAFMVLGGVGGFIVGSFLSNLVMPGGGSRPPKPAELRSARPGAAFLLLTVSIFGGMAAGGLAAG